MRDMTENQELSLQPVVAPKRQFSLATLFIPTFPIWAEPETDPDAQ
jgi:hypothetical protein